MLIHEITFPARYIAMYSLAYVTTVAYNYISQVIPGEFCCIVSQPVFLCHSITNYLSIKFQENVSSLKSSQLGYDIVGIWLIVI